MLTDDRVVGTLDVEGAAVGAFGGADIDRFERLVPALRMLWRPLDDPSPPQPG